MYEFVSEVTLSSDASSIELTNIPSDSTGLEIWVKFRITSNTNIEATLNNDTNTADYDSQRIYFIGVGAPTARNSNDSKLLTNTMYNADQNEEPSIFRIILPEYANGNFASKSIITMGGAARSNNGFNTNYLNYLRYIGGAVNRFKLNPQSGNFRSGTTMSLYKKVGE